MRGEVLHHVIDRGHHIGLPALDPTGLAERGGVEAVEHGDGVGARPFEMREQSLAAVAISCGELGVAGPDVRARDAEFAARDGDGREGLLAHLERACADAVAVLDRLDPAALGEARRIQGRETNVMAAIYHVVEHFSTHTGQLILLAKASAPDGAIRFYDDTGGLARPLFLPPGMTDAP